MRRSVFAVCVCIAAMVAVAGPAVQATAQSGRAGSHVSADGQAAGPASRRDQTGLITGVLLGPYGRPVPGACVTATLEAGRAAKASWAGAVVQIVTVVSAADGSELELVPPARQPLQHERAVLLSHAVLLDRAHRAEPEPEHADARQRPALGVLEPHGTRDRAAEA